MGTRLSYLVFLAGVGVAPIALGIGAAVHDWRLVGVAAVAASLAVLASAGLRRRDRFEAAELSLDAFARGEPPPDEARVGELVSLLREWDALEQKRGSPEFDPWAVQALRHDIQRVIDRDPALNRLFYL